MASLRLLIALSCVAPACGLLLSLDSHFQQWYPQFKEEFESIMSNNCSAEYQRYTEQKGSAAHPEAIASKIVSCIYKSDTLNEAIKANFASATVLLGLLPTILSNIGSNASEASLLSLRRPFLALLLVLGSPGPSPIQSFEYHDPIELIKDKNENVHLPSINIAKKSFIVVAQFLLAAGCAANIIDLGLELGFRTVSSWAPSRVWTVSLWTSLGVAVHLFACVCMHLRVKVETCRPIGTVWRSRLSDIVRDELTLCATHTPTRLWPKDESRWFVFWSWFTSVGTALQIVYGTLTFSGLMFISVQDATIVVARFFLSAVICRAVLMFELNGMRQASAEIQQSTERYIKKTSDVELSQVSQSLRPLNARADSELGLLEHVNTS